MNQQVTSSSFQSFAQLCTLDVKDDLAYSYRRAAWSIRQFFEIQNPDLRDFSEVNLSRWCSTMAGFGISGKTIGGYLETVAAIYNKGVKSGLVEKTAAFRTVKTAIQSYPHDFAELISDSTLEQFCRIVRDSDTLKGDLKFSVDLFIFSFFCGGLDIERVLSLTTDELEFLPESARKLSAGYASPRRKKIFPRALAEDAERRSMMAMHHLGLTFPQDVTLGTAAMALWIAAALQSGLTPGVIRGCLPASGDRFLLTGLVEPEQLTQEEKSEISDRIAASVFESRKRWRILRLRNGVSFDDLKKRIKAVGLLCPEFYYPEEVITLKTGHKLEFRNRPVLRDFVFMKSSDAMLHRILRETGDLGWCYRSSRRGDYAVVPEEEMKSFQRTIGIFGPGFAIEPLGSTPVRIGHRARILGGPMAGFVGTVYDVAGGPGETSVTKLFKLKLPGINGIEWKVDVDERQIEWLDK